MKEIVLESAKYILYVKSAEGRTCLQWAVIIYKVWNYIAIVKIPEVVLSGFGPAMQSSQDPKAIQSLELPEPSFF